MPSLPRPDQLGPDPEPLGLRAERLLARVAAAQPAQTGAIRGEPRIDDWLIARRDEIVRGRSMRIG